MVKCLYAARCSVWCKWNYHKMWQSNWLYRQVWEIDQTSLSNWIVHLISLQPQNIGVPQYRGGLDLHEYSVLPASLQVLLHIGQNHYLAPSAMHVMLLASCVRNELVLTFNTLILAYVELVSAVVVMIITDDKFHCTTFLPVINMLLTHCSITNVQNRISTARFSTTSTQAHMPKLPIRRTKITMGSTLTSSRLTFRSDGNLIDLTDSDHLLGSMFWLTRFIHRLYRENAPRSFGC